ncbi:MAG: VanW family protein [Candidatus Moraniibacteriota bacterium]
MKTPFFSLSKLFAPQVLIMVVFGGSLFSPHSASAMTPAAIVLQAGDYAETIASPRISSFMHLKTRIGHSPISRSEIEDPAFCPTDKLFCAFSLSRSFLHHLHTTAISTPDTEAIKTFVADLAEKVIQDPVDVRFAVADGRVIVATPEKMGRRLKEEESRALLMRVLENSDTESIKISLPTEITAPKLVASDRERLGLKELIGEGHTNFAGSPKNRIYNIKRALEQFQNIIIAPNEEFSFVKYLGDVDGEHGYLPELVIKNNQTTPEFGGGICQVSTTVFRAAIYSGMKITQRRNHAYPVRYYTPYGMDATVYIPKPDMDFINNTPGAILMQSTIEGTELTFRFYGTKDGRTVTVDGPHILASNPDGSMKTVFSQLVTDAVGTSIINDSFWSNYKSPSLFPHPGQEPVLTTKPKGWSDKEWATYKKIHP